MSQRDSGYARKERDVYETPSWVTEALLPHIPLRTLVVWEPAAGSGKMVDVLNTNGFGVIATDISSGHDFLALTSAPNPCHAIITNPPYELATEFIEKAFTLMPDDGFIAMLLRTDFDHAITRAMLFDGCPWFAKKVVLTTRIRWFENSKGQPSFNHAWFIWDFQHKGPPTLAYSGRTKKPVLKLLKGLD